MALSELLQTLKAQAAEQREAELSRAREACDRVRETSAARLARRREEYLARVEQGEREASRRTLSRAQAEAAESVLRARAELLHRIREGVAGRIGGAHAEPEYRAILASDLEDALSRLPPGPVRVSAVSALVGTLEAMLEWRPDVRVEPTAEWTSGFRAFSEDGSAEVDATLESRLEYIWPHLAVKALAELGP